MGRPKWQEMLEAAYAERDQYELRTRNFAALESLERDIATADADIKFSGIDIEDLSRKTLNVLAKGLALKSFGLLWDLKKPGGRIKINLGTKL